MKKFEVEIKSSLVDFTHTKNIWLTVHPTMQNLNIDKRDCPERLLFGLNNRFNCDQNTTSKLLESCFNNEKKAQKNLILYNQNESKLQISQNGSYSFYYFHHSKAKIEIIDSPEDSLYISSEDRLLIFNQPADISVLNDIKKDLSNPSYFSFPLFFAINTKFQELGSPCRLLSLFDFSPNESYGFKIKSSLNTVALTIEMIKNKILKYNYKKIWKIETVLHEALVNAITYGNELNPDFVVHIHYEIGPMGLRIWIQDEGEGFDTKNISVPVGIDALDRISGRGIYMMKKFSDALFFNESGNGVMLFFEFTHSESGD